MIQNNFGITQKHLGRKSNESIPMEVYDENGSVSYNKENVLSKWEFEFSQLFNKVKACENSNFDSKRFLRRSFKFQN